MNRIKVLPESVKNKIAAGEVVEGPFSIVKELMENAIDAGSSAIDVEVFEAGQKKIVVKDNGIGIHKDDLPFSIQSHATSKINDITDIEKISSYGFRGEALSSISSISRFTILTRSKEEEIGAKLSNHSGNPDISDYAGPRGLTAIVENLFYNVPARKKFLKAKSSELRKIREVFLKIAISNPEISFSFDVDGKRRITLPGVEKYGQRLEQVYGKDILESLYFDKLKDIKVEISGYLSKPDFLKSSRSMQILYVNGRYVEYKSFGFLLSRAYEAIAPKGSYPAAFVFIEVDPELVDVNIHPAKREVKFFDERYMNNFILYLPEKILGDQVHKISSSHFKSGDGAQSSESSGVDETLNLDYSSGENSPDSSGPGPDQRYSIEKSLNDETRSMYGKIIRETAKLYKDIERPGGTGNKVIDPGQGPGHSPGNIKTLGIVFNTYIMAEKGNALHFIDFHAAHERFIYDSLVKKEVDVDTQTLVFPQVVELSIEDFETASENMKYFREAGLDIDFFSENSIIVRGIPNIINGLDIKEFFSDAIESLKKNTDHISNMYDIIAEKIACHSAKRAGDKISAEDADIIAIRALNGEHELRCPHGRPFIYKFEKNDLERIFKRQ